MSLPRGRQRPGNLSHRCLRGCAQAGSRVRPRTRHSHIALRCPKLCCNCSANTCSCSLLAPQQTWLVSTWNSQIPSPESAGWLFCLLCVFVVPTVTSPLMSTGQLGGSRRTLEGTAPRGHGQDSSQEMYSLTGVSAKWAHGKKSTQSWANMITHRCLSLGLHGLVLGAH